MYLAFPCILQVTPTVTPVECVYYQATTVVRGMFCGEQ